MCTSNSSSSDNNNKRQHDENDDFTSAKKHEILSPSQQKALDLALSGQSFFFTGRAGSGKSVVLKYMSDRLNEKYDNEGVYLTATTGIAACAIEGTTLHHFAGLGIDINTWTSEELIKKLRKRSMQSITNRWKIAKVLFIDEVSMLDPLIFEKMDRIAREIRSNRLPFGGIQVILTGDFFQLPPVITDNRNATVPSLIFECNAWKRLIGDNILIFTEMFRQTDSDFIEALGEIRIGIITEKGNAMMESARHTRFPPGCSGIVHIFSTRAMVSEMNTRRLSELSGILHKYVAVDWYDNDDERLVNETTRTKRAEQWLAPEILELKIGAQVCTCFFLFISLKKNATTGNVTL